MKPIIPKLSAPHSTLLEKLLAENMEMLHQADEYSRCAVCGLWHKYYEFNDECPLLLRHAVDRLRGMIQYALDAPDDPAVIKKILRDALAGKGGAE